jgi:obg-like ATPase 1
MAAAKKAAAATVSDEKDLALGRFKNSLSIGILGLPNVGKSSLFNLLTKSQALAANYPFATKEPNKARTPLPDERVEWLFELFDPVKRTPAFLECVDIAGLVKGASDGEGMGNEFLSNIAAVDGLYHVCRIFDAEEVTHVEGNVDPIRDLEIIHQELRMKDLQVVKKRMEPLVRLAKGDKTKKFELDVHEKLVALLESGKDVRFGDYNLKEIDVVNPLNLLTAKPQIYLVNMSEDDFIRQKNKWLPRIKEWVEARNPKDPIIPFSAELENKLFDMTPEEAKAYCTEQKTRSMLARIIKMGYSRLRLISFFTIGKPEVRAWTIHAGMKAPQAAGTIHTDFEKKFICAEVMSFADLKEAGSESAVRAAGKLQTKGRDYVMQDGDIVVFKHN